MKRLMLTMAWLALASPAYTQLGGLSDGLKKVQQAEQQYDSLTFSDEEERTIGEDVSVKVRQRFGVVQNAEVHKYVAQVGLLLAQESERPKLAWTFIVLDTDGVNAFASPGGFVHVTRGALGLIRNEAELAAVLGHEIGHVAHKHTINALRKSNAVKAGTSATLANRGAFLGDVANKAYESVLENSFNRGDELDADKVSVQLTQKLGYAAGTLADFLARLDDRNKDQPARNGLFASHPETKERIDKIRQMASAAKSTATVDARYKANVKYEPTAITTVATVADGSAGLTGSTKNADADKKAEAEKKEEPKKKGFGLGSLKPTVSADKPSTQVSASGGARGVGPDRAAKGGSNPNVVKVSVSLAELATFRKGIA